MIPFLGIKSIPLYRILLSVKTVCTTCTAISIWTAKNCKVHYSLLSLKDKWWLWHDFYPRIHLIFLKYRNKLIAPDPWQASIRQKHILQSMIQAKCMIYLYVLSRNYHFNKQMRSIFLTPIHLPVEKAWTWWLAISHYWTYYPYARG